jgi:hypothetical protein
MLILRTCGFSTARVRKIPKGQKIYHDAYFREQILPELKMNSYSDKLITLLTMMFAFDPTERITLDQAIDYLDNS